MVNVAARKAGTSPFRRQLFILLACLCVSVIILLRTEGFVSCAPSRPELDPLDVRSVSSLRNSQLRKHMDKESECHWYLAESAIPNSGLGLFTAKGVLPGEMVGFPDICIYVGDAPKHWTHLRSHTFGGGTFLGQHEGSNSRAACEGFTTTFNTQPDRLINSEMVSPMLPTNAGLHRGFSPGAGSITHHYGIHAKAKDVITAGSELTLYYGDWDFTKEEVATAEKPERPVQWLQKHGWCIDNMRVAESTIPHAGRGAFARRKLKKGEIVAPVPLQSFRDRALFQNTKPEQLYVNYCLQPKGSKMIFYPYGPIFNLINHPDTTRFATSAEQANVHLQWSSSNFNHNSWLDLSYEEFWKVTSPGGLILEVVATRDIQAGDEILLDYGQDWEEAWKAHVAAWRPPSDSRNYVYPAEMDETEALRTIAEQKSNPYPSNLMTMCSTPDWERENGRHIKWEEADGWSWWEGMVPCHVLERKMGRNGNYVYTVSVQLDEDPNDPKNLEYDDTVPLEKQYIDRKVPRRAIRFLEKPYMDDEHLTGAFRHPIEFPSYLVPDAWRNA